MELVFSGGKPKVEIVALKSAERLAESRVPVDVSGRIPEQTRVITTETGMSNRVSTLVGPQIGYVQSPFRPNKG